MSPGRYPDFEQPLRIRTKLFFLDEATALAAGHGTCAEYQRDRFNYFREIWAKANPESANMPRPAATDIDYAKCRQEGIELWS